jgi:prepilin-type N-terminal cleavage/methylation domain-containing protein
VSPRLSHFNLRPSAKSADQSLLRASGFTLLELVMVMMLLCVVAAMAVPSFRGFGKGRRVGACGAQLVTLAQYARTQAVTRAETYRLNVDPATGTYWLTVERAGNGDGGAFERPGDEMGRVFAAPEGVTIAWDGPWPTSAGPRGRGGAQYPYVDFLPTGRTSAAVSLLLTDHNGGAADGMVTEVACLSPAEPFRVLTTEGGQAAR